MRFSGFPPERWESSCAEMPELRAQFHSQTGNAAVGHLTNVYARPQPAAPNPQLQHTTSRRANVGAKKPTKLDAAIIQQELQQLH